jgi:hypothetical protein
MQKSNSWGPVLGASELGQHEKPGKGEGLKQRLKQRTWGF